MPRAIYDPERDRRFAEQVQKQAQAQEAKEEAQFAELSKEVGPKTVNPLQPAQQALTGGGADVVENITGAIDTTFGTNLQEGYRQRKQEAQKTGAIAKAQQQIDQDTSFGAEAIRVATDVVAGSVEDTLNTADLLGDVVKVGFNKAVGRKTAATEDPWSDRYTAAAYSFGLEKPKTEVGKFASKLGKVILIARQVMTKAPKMLINLGTKGKGMRGAIASGLVPGAVADFITTTPEDGNFSAMVNSFIPENSPLHNSFLTALRSEEDDDIFTAKLKGTLEGGITGAVADGLIWMMWGRKAAQRYLKANPKATKEEALEVGLNQASTKMKEVDANNTKAVKEEGARWEEIHSEELEELLNVEREMMDKVEAFKAANISETDPAFKAVQETLDDVRLNLAELDEAIARGYNPDDLQGVLNSESAAYNKAADPNIAIEQQLKAVSPTKGMGEPPVDPFRNSYGSLDGGSLHMLTDAQFKRQAYKPELERLIRDVSSKTELQNMANRLRVPVAKVVEYAASQLDDFRSALKNDIPVDSLVNMMRSRGLLDPKAVDDAKMLSKTGILVTKALIGDTAEQIHNLSKQAIDLRANNEPIGNQLDRALDRLVTLLEFHKTTAYETGSTLEIFRRRIGAAFNGLDAEDSLDLSLKEVREWAVDVKRKIRKGDPEADADVERLVNAMVLAGGDPTKQVKFFHAFVSQGAKQATNAMYQSILSGPITHFRNFLGNGYSLIERPFSTYLRGVLKGDEVVRKSAVAGAHAMFSGVHDAFKIFKQTYKTGTSVNFNTKFAVEDFETQALLRQMNLAANTDWEKISVGLLEKSYRAQNNPWFSWPSRALMAADDFSKSLAARYRIYSQAKYHALENAASPDDVEDMFQLYIKKFSEGIDPANGRILDEDLLNYAERATFQQDPGRLINAVANAVEAMPLGSGRLFLPFIRTPGNLAGYGLEHLPIANQVIRKFDATYLAAKKSGDRLTMAELEGRYATGVMAASLLTFTAMFTDVTGNYPPDPSERKAWQAEGRPPMSIKIGDKWVSYASFEPINSFLSVTADIVRLTKMGGAEGASRAMQQLVYSITAGYTDKSFLAGLSEIGELLSPQNMSDPSQFRMVLNTMNNYAPYAGLRRAFANSLEPYMKEVRGEVDRMLIAAAPGYGNDLPSVTSWITGNKLNSIAGGLFNAVSPIRIQDVNNNVVAKELSDIGYPSNNILKTGQYGVALEPEHREKLAVILSKSGLTKKLEQIINSPDYQKYKEAYKNRPVNAETFLNEDEANPEHYKRISSEINKYKAKALNKLMDIDDSYKLLVAKEKYKTLKASQGDWSSTDIDTIRRYAGLK